MEPVKGPLHTVESLAQSFRDAGLYAGQTVLVHSAMGKIGGWICGGAEAVLLALLEVITPEGTLIMPTHSAHNTDPANWQNPPVPEAWWDTVRQTYPAYDARITASYHMGILPETLRRFPDAMRSNHPIGSFAALGRLAPYFTADHPLEPLFGEESPIGRLYEMDGDIFLLGVGHGNNTSLHLAEYRANIQHTHKRESTAIYDRDGQYQRVYFDMIDIDDEDFPQLGAAYEAAQPDAVRVGRVGDAETRLMRQKPLVDFAVRWLEANR